MTTAQPAQTADAHDRPGGQLPPGQRTSDLPYLELERELARRTEQLTEATCEIVRLADELEEVTAQLAAARQQLDRLTVTDPATGLPNRRRFAELLEAEWRRALRPLSPTAVALLDVDHFKHYARHFGDRTGDQCLLRVAAVLQEQLRGTDVVARFGAEGFALLLPEADVDTAGVIAERLREAVASLQEPHAPEVGGAVTASVGVAVTVPAPFDTADRLVEVAETQLYLAKCAGRNRVATAWAD